MAEQQNLFESFQTADDDSVHLEIKGLTYCPVFLTPQEQETVLASVDARPWQNDLKRRVQHYGYRYDYKARRIDLSMHIGELPGFAVPVAQRLVHDGLMTQIPDQLIVNEYEPGQGIMHTLIANPALVQASLR